MHRESLLRVSSSKVIEFKALPELEEVLLAIPPFERSGDRGEDERNESAPEVARWTEHMQMELEIARRRRLGKSAGRLARAHGALRLLAMLLGIFALAMPAAQAADLQLSACQCLKQSGDPVRVSLSVSNPGAQQAGLLVALHTPNDKWHFFSPDGLIVAPVWNLLPPLLPPVEVDLLNLTLSAESLPFGHFPLVGPFRYEFVAMLYDIQTGEPLAPLAAAFFDFLPADPAPFPSEPGVLHLIPHQHNELAWLEREDVYLPLGADFIRDAIVEAGEDASYRFVVDQKPLLEEFRRRYPELAATLRGLMDTGVCEISSGFLVEADLNLLSGESIVRQAILGQAYAEGQWGHRSRVSWHLDAFGHPHQMPQITRKAGMQYYAFARGIGEPGGFQGTEFLWESPDGSRVLAHYMAHFYQIGREIGQSSETDQEMSELFQLLASRSTTPHLLGLVGADVGENVFAPYLPEAVAHWNSQQIPGVETRISTPTEFFQAVEASGVALPVLSNVEFQDQPGTGRIFPGSYASRIEIKKTNSRQEQLLLDVEKIATLASLEGLPYPQASLETQSENIALNQSHDYLPGVGVDEIYQDDDDELNDLGDRAAAVQATLDQLLAESLGSLVALIDTRSPDPTASAAIVVFNTMAWEREDLVRVPVSDPATALPVRVLNASGAEITYQKIPTDLGGIELVFLASVPATGYATYWLATGDPELPSQEVVSVVSAPLKLPLGPFEVDVDAQGFLSQIRFGGSPGLLAAQAGAGMVWWADEIYGDAYRYDSRGQNTEFLDDRPQAVVLLAGPVMNRVISFSTLADHSLVVREMRVVPALERIDLTITLYWIDRNKNVYLRLPLAEPSGGVITEGVPYGFMQRGEGHYPALRWADFGTDLRGVSVLNRGLFGHHFHSEEGGKILDVTLLRSLDRAVFGEYASTAMLEHGVHRAELALLPREGSWRQRGTPRLAWEWHSPLIAHTTGLHSGALPSQKSYLALDVDSDAVVTVFRRVGDALEVRLYETAGSAGEHSLSFPSITSSEIARTNLLGDTLQVLGSGSSATVTVAPQEIVTLRLATGAQP